MHTRGSTFRYFLSLSFVFFGFSAQAASVSSLPTDTVKGRAPVASELFIGNQSAPGKPPSPDSVLQGTYEYSDDDTDLEEGTRFQWKRGGADISGATSITYAVQPTDDNQELTFQVTPGSVATADPDTGLPVTSAPLAVSSFPPVASSVVVSGLNLVGNPLTASYTYDDPNGDQEGSTLFQWFRNSAQVPGATSRTYNLTSADEGSVIAFEVTPASLTGGLRTGTTVRSADSPVIAPKPGSAPVATSVTSTGKRAVGSTLTGVYQFSDADDDLEGASTFKWLRGCRGQSKCETISGATQVTYLLQDADAGWNVLFEVTPIAKTGEPKTGIPVQQPDGIDTASRPKILHLGSPADYQTADSFCQNMGARIPSNGEMETIFLDSTTARSLGQSNNDMCTFWSWPLGGGLCGGPHPYYWNSTAWAEGHRVINMQTGASTTNRDFGINPYVCVSR